MSSSNTSQSSAKTSPSSSNNPAGSQAASRQLLPQAGSGSGVDKTLKAVGALALLGVCGLAGFMASKSSVLTGGSAAPSSSYSVSTAKVGSSETPAVAATTTTTGSQQPWVAAAPGRVETRGGEIRIASGMLGRVAEVLVKVNDRIEDGELMIRLEDDEARARLSAAEAEAGARKRERDVQAVTQGREDIAKAEDAVFSAGRALTGARVELDYALAARRAGNGPEQQLGDARKRYADARDRLARERLAFAKAQAKPNITSPSRLESALSAARAEVEVAEALLDRTRIRAGAAGTVLQLNAKLAEMVAPTPEQPLVFLGDLSVLRVKAEVEESDVAKIKLGQKAFVRTSSYPGRDFEGKVAALAPSLAPPRIGFRGPRRATDVEVLEVTIELDGSTPLLPGMRTDAFFRK